MGCGQGNLFLIYLFRLCWVFTTAPELSLVVVSGGCSLVMVHRLLLFQSTDSRCTSSVVAACRLSCSAPCGIFPDQGSNLCLLHWQADSYPQYHQRSPRQPLSALIFLPKRQLSLSDGPEASGGCLGMHGWESHLQEVVWPHEKAPPAPKSAFTKEAGTGTWFPTGTLQRALEVKGNLKALERSVG